jgi:hypothetical protein
MNIQVSVQPAPGSDLPVAGGATVEINYARTITPEEGETDDQVAQSARLVLDEQLKGSVRLENAASAQMQASVLAADGSALLSRTLSADSGKAVLTLGIAEVALIKNGRQQIPADTTPLMVARTARLVPTGSVKVDYARSSVMVAPLKDLKALTASGVDALLKSGGTRITSMEVTGQDLGTLTRLAWTPTHLAVDGTFTASFTQQPAIGWLWWLIGEQQVLGFMLDNLEAADTKTFMIALPALSAPSTTAAGTPEKGCGRAVPANVTEAEVANNPAIYSEDPGAFCRPFSNPERVLSEKSFAVIARITQPEIGPLGSVKIKTMRLLNLEGDVSVAAPSSRASGARGRASRASRTSVAATASVASRLSSSALAGAALPSRHHLVDRYVDLLNRLPAGRTSMDANHPLQWEDDIAQYQAATVAIGHILEFRVRWRSNGYSLGTVAKTLTLAPRQTKRIQKIEWERSDRARRSERTQLRDQENDSTVRERDYHDHVAAHLSEWASGRSSSDTEAVAGGIGFFASGIIGGIGGGAASAHSSSHQDGGRDTTASEEQRLRDSIRRHGDALRKFESTVVNEVTQEETVTGTTEVIRNANYMHSLTVIYYQILRHLKVSTEFAGVRECIFVPFAIKPFDLQRAYRWRESLQASIRSPLYSRALRYLKDVATGFATSDIAPGPRAGQQLTYLRGSVYVSLGVERPRDTAEGLFDAGLWQVAQPLLQTPALGIFSLLATQSAAQRDRIFQAEHAPSMAARWANRIQLRTTGGRVLHADCTLASRYQFNGSVRIDFAVPANELLGLSRQALQQLTVIPELGLPPGSVANLTRLSLVYNTDRYEHAVEGRTGTNDLVRPASGNPDNATVVLPLDNWERVDEQLEIRRSVDQLIEHLNEHVEYYHKAIWWRMDRDRLMMMLDGFYVPNTNNVSIASVVDREPVGIIGNSLVYRVGAASFLGYGKVTTPAALYNVYANKEPVTDPVLISLPTDGLYAQTIMDECAALEEHYGNTDWVLNDKEPDLGTIDPSLMLSRRADQTTATTPTAFPGTIINLQNAPEAPAPSGLQGVLNAVTNPNAFRDMAGLAGTQANALAALNTAANLATNFGNQAAALELAKLAKADQATRTADQKIASIKGAVDKGLSTPADAAQATRDVLSAMNPDSPRADAPHENAAINSAIDSARTMPGSMIEANTSEGGVRVKMGGGDLQSTLENMAGAGNVVFASAGGSKTPQEHIILVGGPSNSYNGYGKVVDDGTGTMVFKLNPAPTTLGGVDAFINSSLGNVTHDKYWADFLEPVPRLFTNGLVKPKENDIVTVIVYYPPFMKRQERDWAASPWNTQKWMNSPWVNGKDPYDPMVKYVDQGAIVTTSAPTSSTSATPPKNLDYATQKVSEERIDHEILMRSTTETRTAAQTYSKRPTGPNQWIDDIHNVPRRILYGNTLGGAASMRGVLVKILLVNDPQQILEYLAMGKLSTKPRYWKNLLDTYDEEDMGNMEGPSGSNVSDTWWDYAFAPSKMPAAGQQPNVPAAWKDTPDVDRRKVKIARLDYFGHSNQSALFLKYAWANNKGDAAVPHGEVLLTADEVNSALAGKNATTTQAEAKLWGCSLGNDFADKLTESFSYVQAAESLTTFENVLSSPTAMPEPVSGGWSQYFAPVTL